MHAHVPPDMAAPSPIASRGFAAGYPVRAEAPDEMAESDGSLRSHWVPFVTMLDEIGPEELKLRWDHARRLIHDNGVSHNVYGDPQGLDRPWNLDAVPVLIRSEEWDHACAGMAQRARLLDRLLADLYGPLRTLYDRILPADLIWANPGFLRSCSGARPAGGKWIHLYAADLVRAAGGQFQVLNDRTQAPSGAGYALENRIVLSRVLPTVYRQSNVHRLAPFFVALRESLASLASAQRESPRVVLLTPGPYNETYFEHSYMARYLGYPLVQGNDLTVRDSFVYLKTLSGLQRVDVILRRVDDYFCDPLELYQDSYLGVSGLLQAARKGNVAIANALGSGLVQSQGLLPFLPALCRYFLSEELILSSVPTWWCGEREGLQYALDHLPEMVIKSAFSVEAEEPVFCGRLSAEQLAALSRRINARPERYVAQHRVTEASTPALVGDQLQPRRFAIRGYLASSADGYVPMHGGLARVTASQDTLSVSLQQGAGSKDLWILSDGPVSQVTLLPSGTHPMPVVRGGGDLPSRIADDLFWLGRYTERTEAMARLARGTMSKLIDHDPADRPHALRTLLDCLGVVENASSDLPFDNAIAAFVFDPNRASSIRGHVANVNRLARGLRDQISIDAWRILQESFRTVFSFRPSPHEPASSALDMLDDLIEHCAAFAGIVVDSMTRGQTWLFLDIGRRIERADATANLLRDTLMDCSDDAELLETVLEITDSSVTYRRRYLTYLESHAVVDLLLADETNPRAVAFQLAEIERHLAALPRDAAHVDRNVDQHIILELRAMVQRPDIIQLCACQDGLRDKLDLLLEQTSNRLRELSTAITKLYFSHSTLPQELGQSPPEADA